MNTRLIPFVFSVSDTALLELTDSLLRIWVDDALVERTADGEVASITNGEFTSNITGWTDESDVGASISWDSTAAALSILGDGTNFGHAEQEMTLPFVPASSPARHGLRVVVARGPVILRVGSTSGGEDYISERSLGTGTHTIAFTPEFGSIFVRFSNQSPVARLIDTVSIEDPDIVEVATPWTAADLEFLRFDQSGDVVFVACRDMQPRRIERWGYDSWSVVLYQPSNGPWRIENTSTITITPGALNGNTTLTASKAIFREGHVGSLWRLNSTGQQVAESISAQNTFSDPIRVTSLGDGRIFAITITGTWVGTVTLQRSVGQVGSWEDVPGKTWTANTDETYTDELDNQIIYYRAGIKTGAYTSGTAEVDLSISTGSIDGIARVTGFTSSTVVDVEVLEDFGGTDPTELWTEGLWSDYRGWPSAVALHDGRLWWGGKDRFVGSVVDGFNSFDDRIEGDAGPIVRTIGAGPVDNINWLLSLTRLMAGTDAREISCRSSALDEPLTPTNFVPKAMGNQGTAPIQAVAVDNKGIFVQRGGWRVYEISYAIESGDYGEADLTQICPEFLSPGIVAIAVQRQPDTRIHFVRSDGTVGILVFDRVENVICWWKFETDGDVEEVAVLPGDEEDKVYYVIKRTIEGEDRRYLERWAKESECRGGSMNLQADSFVYDAAASSTITGLDHLDGETVVVWAQGQDLGEFVVSGGTVTLDGSYTDRCAGLPYTARFKSAKLAYIAPPGKSALGQPKRGCMLSLVLADTHPNGLQFGPDFDSLDRMPLVEEGADVDQDAVWENYEGRPIPFGGRWQTDTRLCLQAQAPRPVTVMGAVLDMES